jgi:hypothetical protein
MKVDVLAYEWMDSAFDVVTSELVSELLCKLLEVLQQTPINALIWLNIAAAIAPELAGVNRVRPKFCEPVGDLIKLNQRFENSFAFTSTGVIALEP